MDNINWNFIIKNTYNGHILEYTLDSRGKNILG